MTSTILSGLFTTTPTTWTSTAIPIALGAGSGMSHRCIGTTCSTSTAEQVGRREPALLNWVSSGRGTVLEIISAGVEIP